MFLKMFPGKAHFKNFRCKNPSMKNYLKGLVPTYGAFPHPPPPPSKNQVLVFKLIIINVLHVCCIFLEYDEGKDFYTKAIKCCPKEFKQDKSIFYANRAACYQKLVGKLGQTIVLLFILLIGTVLLSILKEDYENAISDCSQGNT